MNEDGTQRQSKRTLGDGFRSAVRNLGWLLASRGLEAVLSLVHLGLATRSLGVHDFGRFILITGASQTLVTFVAFPTWQLVIQYGAPHLLAKDDAAFGRLLRACGLLDVFSALLGVALSVGILALFAPELGIGPSLQSHVLAFAVVQLVSLRSTPLGILRLRDRYAQAAWASSVTPLVRITGSVLAVWLLPTVEGFLLSWAAAEIATAAAFWLAASRTGDLRLMLRAPSQRGSLHRENPRFVRVALATNANVSLGLGEKQIPVLMIGAYVGSSAAGLFRLAYQLGRGLFQLAPILTRAAFPELVRSVRTNDPAELRRLLFRMAAASTAVALPILLVVAAAGPFVLRLVGGKEYEPAYPILVWIAVAGCLDLATVGFEPVLQALHRSATVFSIRAATAFVLLAAMATLTPIYGAVGAAIALSIGGLVTELSLGIASFRAVASARAAAAPATS